MPGAECSASSSLIPDSAITWRNTACGLARSAIAVPGTKVGTGGSTARVMTPPAEAVAGALTGPQGAQGPQGVKGDRGEAFSFATGADLRVATSQTKALTPKSVADAAALVALTDAATIAVDLAAGTNFTVTLAGNRTLGAPTNAKPGMSGTILIKQDATGSRTLAYNTAWKPFGSTPALSTAASAVDLLTWIVEDTGKVRFTLAKGGAV